MEPQLKEVDQTQVLKEKIALRDLVIDKQREMIDILRKELNRKRKWWQIWRW